MKNSLLAGSLAIALCAVANPAFAQDLVHQPISPTFGGNPFNSSHIQGTANAAQWLLSKSCALDCQQPCPVAISWLLPA